MENIGNYHSFLHAKYGANRFYERRVMAEIRFTFFYIRWKKLGGSESAFSTHPKGGSSDHQTSKQLFFRL